MPLLTSKQEHNMKQRSDLIRWVGAAVIAATLPLSAYAKAKGSNPNIVVILADDMGYGDAGCYNADSKVPTPNLDKMAREGMRFTDAHSPSAVCSPTRYGLLTGRYSWRTEMKRGVLGAWGWPQIEKDRLTLASMLNQHDYHTACIGKWHLGWDWQKADGTTLKIDRDSKHEERVKLAKTVDYTKPIGGGPLDAGFDYYYGDGTVNQPPYLWIENDRCLTQPTEPLLDSIKAGSSNGPATPDWDQTKVLPRITESAVQYIHELGKQKDTPFFLYFPLTAPHVPVMPGKQYIGRSTYGAYGDFVCQVDDIVGKITKELEHAGLAENTLVIFSSDNGSFAPAKKGHSPNGALRGKKTQIFEGGHRVPFLVRWPGKTKDGSVNHQLVGINDVMATVAEIVGHDLPEDACEDSTSLLPTLLDPAKPVRQDLVHHSRKGEFAIREGDWKLITDSERKPIQLFNIGTDLGEKNNVFKKCPETVKRLADKLEKQYQSGRSVKLHK
jgi:arylsulfatase A-like enzyme